MKQEDICKNIERIKKRIEKACERSGRNPEDIRIVAVSKTKPVDFILKAMECGHLLFGENRMKELEEKMAQIDDNTVSWHMIGNLQTNKIKYIADRVNYIHSVEKVKQLDEIQKRAANADRIINCLIQVNISNEKQKGGCKPEKLSPILEQAGNYPNIQIKGLMGMAEFTEDAERIRLQFRLLKKLRDEHQSLNSKNIELKELSMGMSNDFEIAVEEGATLLRIGSAIFGERNYNLT